MFKSLFKITTELAPPMQFSMSLAFTHLKTSVQCNSPSTFFSPKEKKKETRKKSMTFNSALLICLDNAAIELCFCQW